MKNKKNLIHFLLQRNNFCNVQVLYTEMVGCTLRLDTKQTPLSLMRCIDIRGMHAKNYAYVY